MKILIFLTVLSAAYSLHDWSVTTPLDAYVNAPERVTSHREIDSWQGEGYTTYVLNFTSLTWMDETVSETPVWWHFLSIAVPDRVVFNDAACIRIGAGNNDEDEESPDEINDSTMRLIGAMARDTGAVVAYLKQNPNQPIIMVDEPIPRVEDMIIGYTWRKYIEAEGTPNPNITLQLPMVKSAKIAMDVVTEVARSKNPAIQITRYMPTGYSKRGWVSWLLACVDRRVFATAPIVLSILNFVENLHHHRRAYGGWSWAFTPYWMEDVSRHLNHPRTQDLANFIDPLAYNPRLTMPKMLFSAVGDQFFMPDDTHYFWDRLSEPKQFLLIENTDHGMSGKRDVVNRNVEAFFVGTLTNFQFPRMSWMRNETQSGGSISLYTDTTPTASRSWMVDTNATDNMRDFRMAALEQDNEMNWIEGPVTDQGNGNYYVTFDKRPDAGWRGFFISNQFAGPGGRTIDLTSEFNIIPDTFPYPRCQTPDECDGEIV